MIEEQISFTNMVSESDSSQGEDSDTKTKKTSTSSESQKIIETMERETQKIPETCSENTLKISEKELEIRGIIRQNGEILSQFPVEENGFAQKCVTLSGQQYYISQRLYPSIYFTLWKAVEQGYMRLYSAPSPLLLDDLIPWED